jgi:hypothetical protein
MDTRPSVLRSPVWAAGAIAFAAVGLATLSIAPKLWLGWILPRLQPHVTLWYVGAGSAILAGLGAWAWSAGAVNRAPALAALAAVMGVYVLLLLTVYRHEPPAKKWHLIQYAFSRQVGVPAGGRLRPWFTSGTRARQRRTSGRRASIRDCWRIKSQTGYSGGPS